MTATRTFPVATGERPWPRRTRAGREHLVEGTYSEIHPRISQDLTGMQRLDTQFSFPGGIPSHVAPETPGSTTPFDMLVVNDMDRFHIVMDVIDRVPGLARRAAVLRPHMVDERAEHRAHVRRTGEDLPEIRDWTWPTA